MKTVLPALLFAFSTAPTAIAQCYFPIQPGSLAPQYQYDLVVVADGYTNPCYVPQTVQPHFQDALAFKMALNGYEPFSTYQSYVSIHGIHRQSPAAGADHPEIGSGVFVNTPYNSTYDVYGVDRCLQMSNSSSQNGPAPTNGLQQADLDAMSTAPGYDGHLLAIVNDPTYGGCAEYDFHGAAYNGNQLPNVDGAHVAVHELGHVLGLLGDEYGGSLGTYMGLERPEPNLTIYTNPLKWAIWLGTGGIASPPPPGGREFNFGIYHPKATCMMNDASSPFCEVCREQLVKRIYTYADSFVLTTPPDATPISVLQGLPVPLSFLHRIPTPAPTITWSVDGTPQGGASGLGYNLDTTMLAPGPHTVTASIRDNTLFVKSDPTNLLLKSRTWTVNVQAPTPDLQFSLFGHALSNVEAGGAVTLSGQVDNVGTGAAGNFFVEYFLSADAVIDPATDYYLGITALSGLGTGLSSPLNVSLQTHFHLGPGPWYLGAVVDRLGFITELSETNNSILDPATLSLAPPTGCPSALEFDAPLSYLGHYARVSNSAGATLNMQITSPCNAGEIYLIGVSGTGTSPGTVLGPNLVLPLVYDSVTQFALGYVNQVPLLAFGGVLNASGRATASFAPPPGFFGGSNIKLYFATAIYTQGPSGITFTAVTNAAQIAIDP